MSEYLGFLPTEESPFVFLSYNSDDYSRIVPIVTKMSKEIPFWYDYAIPYDDRWEEIIERKIAEANAVVVFLTKAVLIKKDSYVMKEYKIAKAYNQKVIVILLDHITETNAPFGTKSFVIDVLERHVLDVSNMDSRRAAIESVKAIKSKVDLDLPRKTMEIVGEDGAREIVEVVVSFELTDSKKEFVVYTKNERDDQGNTTVYVSKIDRGQNGSKLVEVDDADWPKIRHFLRYMGEADDLDAPPTYDLDGVEIL